MGNEMVERILATRQPVAAKDAQGSAYFSIVSAEEAQESFLELRFRGGLCSCFSYTDLKWFNYDPEAGFLDLEFSGYLVTIKGRGLVPALFRGLKAKRVDWIKEADSEAEDIESNENFIESILITPPGTPEGKGSEEGQS